MPVEAVFLCYAAGMTLFLAAAFGANVRRFGPYALAMLGLAFWLLPALWVAGEAAFPR